MLGSNFLCSLQFAITCLLSLVKNDLRSVHSKKEFPSSTWCTVVWYNLYLPFVCDLKTDKLPLWRYMTYICSFKRAIHLLECSQYIVMVLQQMQPFMMKQYCRLLLLFSDLVLCLWTILSLELVSLIFCHVSSFVVSCYGSSTQDVLHLGNSGQLWCVWYVVGN